MANGMAGAAEGASKTQPQGAAPAAVPGTGGMADAREGANRGKPALTLAELVADELAIVDAAVELTETEVAAARAREE